MFLVALPFVLAVSGLGMVVAKLFRSPIVAQLVSAAVRMPFLFSGFSWPGDATPEPLRTIALIVPSTSAINAFVNVGQVGAELSDVRSQVLSLGVLAIALAVALEVCAPRTIRGSDGSA
ncbi:ABC transporter permease [Rhizobium hidalgonense]|uniref:ABC transporter permease n=1 Tax=Rhizobium hidalgonense TaxID=1538159 RepID=UPI00247859D8|nr:ABC transporter permease [Rhizobium hidalgonense]